MRKTRPLNDLSFSELKSFLSAEGGIAEASESEVRKIIHSLYSPGSFTKISLASPVEARQVRRNILSRADEGYVARLEVLERRRAADGFVKYLFKSPIGGEFEAVRIPIFSTKYVVCVSSQIGCALGCAFCQTGKMGFIRNLETWEILEQVRIIRDESTMPVRHAVFMGMGEPLLNYDSVMRAAKLLSEPGGIQISGRNITISTAGIVPAIQRYVSEKQPYRLAFSLGSAIPQKREKLMPVERSYNLERLFHAIKEYSEARKERAMIAYVMLAGVNTLSEDVDALKGLFENVAIKLDLIDVADASGTYRALNESELKSFRDELQKLGVPIARRYSGGVEIGAACGTLAATRFGGEIV